MNNAYLTYLLQQIKNKQANKSQFQASNNQGSDSFNLSDALNWAKKGKKVYDYGKKAYNWYNENYGTSSGAGGSPEAPSAAMGTYTPAAYSTGSSVGAGAMPAGTASAGDIGLTGSVAGASAGAGTAQGGGWASVGAGGVGAMAAPFIAAWLANQAGSGVNQPVQNQMETNEASKYFKDYITNKGAVDPNQYNLPGLMGDDALIKANPLQYLYTHMHDMGKSGNISENTGYNDQQIDDMIYKQGVTPEELKAALGYDLPDWSKMDWREYTRNKYAGPMYDTNTFLG